MTWVLAYAAVSFLIGIWCELEMGSRWDSSPWRMARMAGYTVTWPLVAVAAAWFWLIDTDDLL